VISKRPKRSGLGTKENLEIFSLNVNRIQNKLLELNEYLIMKTPDIFCLQETHRTQTDAKLVIGNYSIIEVCAKEKKNMNGLARYRNELIDRMMLEKAEDFCITISLLWQR